MTSILTQSDPVLQIRQWAQALGFVNLSVTSPQLPGAAERLQAWTDAGYHGDMAYMQAYGAKRAEPQTLVPGVQSVLTVMLPYLPDSSTDDWVNKSWAALESNATGYVSWYARGRDYHKVMRARLQALADTIDQHFGKHSLRVFSDSAPVLEVELAVRGGLGWRGKHTLLLNREQGSLFFLGEIFLDLALTPTPPTPGHCGSCTRCIDVCPTKAIVAPYQLDARRCISYLTIEHKGVIPVEMRPAIGNRIYGCDDCQLACPWNKYAQKSSLSDFEPKAALQGVHLAEQLLLTQSEFETLTAGTPIRRIGHERWQRNVAVACGNALTRAQVPESDKQGIRQALGTASTTASPLVAEHVQWALGNG